MAVRAAQNVPADEWGRKTRVEAGSHHRRSRPGTALHSPLSIGMESRSALKHDPYDIAVVTAKGARRWQLGHPWIYRSDVSRRPNATAGPVRVADHRGKRIGTALWSPASELSLRMVDGDSTVILDAAWWRRR